MAYCMIFYTVVVDFYRKHILKYASTDFQICQEKNEKNGKKNLFFYEYFYFFRKKNEKIYGDIKYFFIYI